LDETTPLEVIEEIKQMDATIRKTAEKLEFVSKDKEALRLYHLREMGISDFTTAVNTALEKQQMGFARNLLQAGSPLDFIQRMTGLDMDAIKSLREI
jgi:hypothetical protein